MPDTGSEAETGTGRMVLEDGTIDTMALGCPDDVEVEDKGVGNGRSDDPSIRLAPQDGGCEVSGFMEDLR